MMVVAAHGRPEHAKGTLASACWAEACGPRWVGLERVGGWVVVPRRPGAREGELASARKGGKLSVPRPVDLERAGGWVVVQRTVH
jgi:hypothetical protein